MHEIRSIYHPLLENWTPASSLANFKLAWKTTSPFELVMAKYISDLALLWADNEHFFFIIMWLFLFQYLVIGQISQAILHIRFIFNLIPVLCSTGRYTWEKLNLSRRKIDYRCAIFILGAIDSTVEFVSRQFPFGLWRYYVLLRQIHFRMLCRVLLCPWPWQLMFPWYPFCRRVIGPWSQLLLGIIFQHTILLILKGIRIQYRKLPWTIVSNWFGTYQRLTAIKLCKYVWMLGHNCSLYQAN